MVKKITIFYDADYATMEGGGQKRLYEIFKVANKTEENIINWISFKFWETGPSFEKGGIKYEGVISKPNFYKKNGQRNSYEPILYFFNCLLSIPKFIRSDTYIIGQWPLLHILPIVLIGLIFKKNIYVEWWETLQNQWIKKGFLGRIGALIERLIIYSSSYVVFVVECESEKKLITEINRNAKVEIIENGVDINKYHKLPIEKKYDFICVGRLVSQKNVDIIVKSIYQIKLKYDQDISICIVGDGPEKSKIEKLIKDLNLDANVKMFGFVEKEEDKNKLIQESRIGVIAQDGVGKGNLVVYELMAGGIPVIAVGTDNGLDRSYILEGITGYFAQSLDYNQLADDMYKMLVNKDKIKEMSNYLESNIKSFSWQEKLKSYPAFYSNKIDK